MEFFRIHRTIPLMHYRHVLNAISFVSFIVAVYWDFHARFGAFNRVHWRHSA